MLYPYDPTARLSVDSAKTICMRYGLQGFTKNLASEATEELQERLNQALQRLLEQLNHAA